MQQLEQLLETLPDSCKDTRLNLPGVLKNSSLSAVQAWSIALTCAYFLRARELATALLADGATVLGQTDIDDAQAAASLMGMNTIYYRFRHLVHKDEYQQLKAGLRMNRMSNPQSNKAQFELCSIACAALAGCEMCIMAHEHTLVEHGISPNQIHDAVRIASVVSAAHVALGLV